MTAGAAYVVGPTSVADDGFLDLQPAGADEAVVHNVYVPEGVAYELYWHGADGDIKFDHDTNVGRGDIHSHVTNATFVRVKNVSGSSALFGADGMYTAPPPAS